MNQRERERGGFNDDFANDCTNMMVDIKTSLTGHKRVTEYHALNLPLALSSLLSE